MEAKITLMNHCNKFFGKWSQKWAYPIIFDFIEKTGFGELSQEELVKVAFDFGDMLALQINNV